ncbi:hypothetical protein [Polaribacter aquimarinus]|uniref:Lipoprotein n=1 Tax=Polaribacter aquimarinus TaxID=2100726 RepID=A0A2U2JBB7_9FLAO|nr:hypothetical protein [Polaribacter aquimarinus]PWG05624.1 hypothetical protein DIS07_04045 [Polaribacter aquimarinus]
MKLNYLYFTKALLVVAFLLVGCSNSDDDTVAYNTATVDHWGFDFSEGIGFNVNSTNPQNSDGETISWHPKSSTKNQNTISIWWRTKNSPNETKDMGTVPLETITQAPTTWDGSPNIPPLKIGNSYVAKCLDGYVKFEVLSFPTSDDWAVEVKYYFSTSATFND